MSVRLRLGLTFAVLIGVFLVPVRYAGARLNELREMAVERRSDHASATLAVGSFRAGMANYDSNERAYLVTLDSRMSDQVDAALDDLRSQLVRLRDASYGEVSAELGTRLDSLAAVSRQIDRFVEAGRIEPATRLYEGLDPLRDRMESELAAIAAAIDRNSAADFARAQELSATAATVTIFATLAAVLLAALVGIWTTGALTGPLAKLTTAVARVADGAFRRPEDLPYDRDDEIGELSRSFGRMTRRLEELDRLKAEFMSVASHELKTPISVIRGYTELLEEELGDERTPREADLLTAIAEQADVMTRLVSRLLDIGRLEAGTYRMQPEEVHVTDLLNGLVSSFDVLARERGIRFVTEVEETAPDTIRADPDMLRGEVLGNLVSNALRFTPEGGEVRVRVRRRDEEVLFEVSDTGPGIPEDQRPHIFEKYYEGGRTQSMGSGLGLAVAKAAIEAHGGRIALAPGGDGGATFRVFLPLAPEEPTV